MNLKCVNSLQNICLVKLASHLFSLKMVPNLKGDDQPPPWIDEEVLAKLELYPLPPNFKIKLKNILCYMRKWLQNYLKKEQFLLFGIKPSVWFPSACWNATGAMDVAETVRTYCSRLDASSDRLKKFKFEAYCKYCIEEDQIINLGAQLNQPFVVEFNFYSRDCYYFLANKIPSLSQRLKDRFQSLFSFEGTISWIIQQENVPAFNYFWPRLPPKFRKRVLKGTYGHYAPFMKTLLAHNVCLEEKTIKSVFTKNLIDYYLDMWLWYGDRFLDVLEENQSLLSDEYFLRLLFKIINVMQIYVVIDDLLRVFERFWSLSRQRIAHFNPYFRLESFEKDLINSDGKDRAEMVNEDTSKMLLVSE